MMSQAKAATVGMHCLDIRYTSKLKQKGNGGYQMTVTMLLNLLTVESMTLIESDCSAERILK